jgi:hypothetical protein
MSEHQFGKSTRRTFLGTAAVASAATLTGVPATQAQSADRAASDGTRMAQLSASATTSPAAPAHPGDWTKPAAMAIPKEGYFKVEQGRYGPIFPKTPANYGFSILAKIKPGREEAIRQHGNTIEKAVAGDPSVLAPLKLHYLRWLLFSIGNDTYFMYQGIFDTDFDKYTEDAVSIFSSSGITTVFENLEGFPVDWKSNPASFVKFVREHQVPSFLEYGEYPYVTADEIKSALKVKRSLSAMLDQMQ